MVFLCGCYGTDNIRYAAGGFSIWEFSYDCGSRRSGTGVREADDKRKK